jgi:hypothetical protein
VTERQYAWQEVSRLYLSEINKQTFGDLPSIFESLKKKHGEEARIEMDTYQTCGNTFRGEGYVAPEVHTYFRVMKYMPVATRQERFDEFSAKQEMQLAASEPKRKKRLEKTLKLLSDLK